MQKAIAVLFSTFMCIHLMAEMPWDVKQDRVSAVAYKECRGRVSDLEAEQMAVIISDTNHALVTPSLIMAIINTESSWNHVARNKSGSTGLMQLLPSTARQMGVKTRKEMRNPLINLKAGITYLIWLCDANGFTRVEQIISSYRIGPSRGKHNPKWNRWYVNRVKSKMKAYQKDGIP